MDATDIDLTGCYDVVYSPDDGGWYADLLWDRKITSPTFSTQTKANAWALKKGGTRCLRVHS